MNHREKNSIIAYSVRLTLVTIPAPRHMNKCWTEILHLLEYRMRYIKRNNICIILCSALLILTFELVNVQQSILTVQWSWCLLICKTCRSLRYIRCVTLLLFKRQHLSYFVHTFVITSTQSFVSHKSYIKHTTCMCNGVSICIILGKSFVKRFNDQLTWKNLS